MKVLITGASSGLGFALVERALECGYHVVAATREPASILNSLTNYDPTLFEVVKIPSVMPGIATEIAISLSAYGDFDIVINNAGMGLFGPLEELQRLDLDQLFELNVFLPLEIMRMATAQLRQRGGGTIVNISSVSGHLGGAGYGAYAASKAALSTLTEALAEEVQPFRIQVLLIEAGRLDTDFVLKATQTLGPVSPYLPHVGENLKIIQEDRNRGAAKVEIVATEIFDLIGASDAPLRYFVGGGAHDIVSEKIDALLDGAAILSAARKRLSSPT